MTRLLRIPLLSVALALGAAAPASARVVELGTAPGDGKAKPSCPGNPCLSVTRTTGFQATAGDRRNQFAAPSTGRVVAVTVALGRPSASQISFFNRQAGGTPRLRVAVLRPVGNANARVPQYRLNAQSDDFAVQSYFGQTIQIPLYTTLLVRRGDVIALTVPTWAPILAVDDLSNSFAWRSSRSAPCSTNPERQPPHTMAGSTDSYFCLYRPAMLTYSVTMVTAPAASAPRQG